MCAYRGIGPRRPHRPLLLGAGYASLALAALGAVLPLMPTTVFLLVAAWCFGRASPALRKRLLADPRFGRTLQDWEEHRTISLRAKRAAVLAMALSWALVALVSRDVLVSAVAGTCMAVVGLFILTRPSRPRRCRSGMASSAPMQRGGGECA